MVSRVGVEPTFTSSSASVLPFELPRHRGGFCSRHIPNIVSACGVWFTFVSRYTYTPCGRVMGQRSYGLSWVFPFGTALPSPFVPLLYHNLGDLSRGFWNFFQRTFFTRCAPHPWCLVDSSWLLLHCITHRAVCQEGCWKKSQLFFNGRFPTQYGHGCDTPTFRFCIPTGPAQLVRCLTLLTPIVYHISP